MKDKVKKILCIALAVILVLLLVRQLIPVKMPVKAADKVLSMSGAVSGETVPDGSFSQAEREEVMAWLAAQTLRRSSSVFNTAPYENKTYVNLNLNTEKVQVIVEADEKDPSHSRVRISGAGLASGVYKLDKTQAAPLAELLRKVKNNL